MTRQTRLDPYVRDAINRVKNSIDHKPFDRKTVTRFAHDVGVGRNLLQKHFKQFFGATINQYQKKKCMEVAAGMLEEDHLPLFKIASKCGYGSQSSFARVFKEVYGITPTKWKKSDKLSITAGTTGITETRHETGNNNSKKK